MIDNEKSDKLLKLLSEDLNFHSYKSHGPIIFSTRDHKSPERYRGIINVYFWPNDFKLKWRAWILGMPSPVEGLMEVFEYLPLETQNWILFNLELFNGSAE